MSGKRIASILAVGANGQVLRSPNGDLLHVQYGNCTLTLSSVEFNDLCQMLEEATAALHQEQDRGDATFDSPQKV